VQNKSVEIFFKEDILQRKCVRKLFYFLFNGVCKQRAGRVKVWNSI